MTSTVCKSVILTIAAFVLTVPASAGDVVTCKQMDEILLELQQIRKLLDSKPNMPSQPQATTAQIEVGDAPFLGSKDAPLTIVEFTDYQCSFCQQFHKQTFPDLKRIYIDSGKVRFYSMDLPLVQIHPNALQAAQAARCAGEQGRFWVMHDHMLTKPESLEMAKLADYAAEVGMNVAAFRECVEGGKHKSTIEEGARDVVSKGAQGTPAFIIGKSTSGGVEGELFMGAVPFGVFEKKIKEITSSGKSTDSVGGS